MPIYSIITCIYASKKIRPNMQRISKLEFIPILFCFYHSLIRLNIVFMDVIIIIPVHPVVCPYVYIINFIVRIYSYVLLLVLIQSMYF